MKRRFLKLTMGSLFASLTMVGGMPIVVSAHGDKPPEPGIAGAWRVALTPRNCVTGDPLPALGAPYQGLYTFHKGGTLSEWLTNTVVLPTLRSPGHGVWRKAGDSQSYSYSFIFNRYDTLGMITGTQQGRAELVLGESGNDYTASSTVQIFDVDGNLLSRNCSTIEGTRYE
jgi:hypothetical protein